MQTKYAQIQGYGPLRRITLSNSLDAPIKTVWEVLTQVDHMAHWWPDWEPGGVVEPTTGGKIKLGDGSWIDGTIKTWAPPYLFEFTWHDQSVAADGSVEAALCSIFRVDLIPLEADKTLLNLVQYLTQDNAVGGTAGWHQFAGYQTRSSILRRNNRRNHHR